MKKVILTSILFFLLLILSSCSVKNVTVNKVNKDNNLLGQSNIKFVFFTGDLQQ